MTAEEKALEKIRKVLIADATLEPYVNKRVYTSHISSIQEPKYPAISMFLLSSKPSRLPEYVHVRVQIDAWLPSSAYNATDVLAILERLRALLNKTDAAQELNDSTIGVVFAEAVQVEAGPMMHEDDTELFHLPSIFEMAVK